MLINFYVCTRCGATHGWSTWCGNCASATYVRKVLVRLEWLKEQGLLHEV